MSNDENILTALQLHDDGLKTNNNITVGLSATIAVVVFIIVTGGKVLRELFLDFGVCETITDTSIKLIKSLPLKLIIGCWKETCSLVSALEGGGPDSEGSVILEVLAQREF